MLCIFLVSVAVYFFFFFQAEDGIRDLVRSRGLGDVYKRQTYDCSGKFNADKNTHAKMLLELRFADDEMARTTTCLLYTSDAADDLLCVDLGGRSIIKKKKNSTVPS